MAESKPKSKRATRRYQLIDLPKYVQQPLKLQPLKLLQPQQQQQQSQQPLRRPKSEIVRELRRLRSTPIRLDDEEPAATTLLAPAAAAAAARPLRSLEQLQALHLTRHRLEQLLGSSAFEQTALNCFVRLNINPGDVPAEHRIAEIVGIVHLPEGYYVGKLPTNIALQLRYEDVVLQHEFNVISNMAFTPDEFAYWRDNCVCQAIELPTTELLARKKLELYNALNGELRAASILLKTNSRIPTALPMRPVPRVSLLERFGGVYPWKLQRPPPIVQSDDAAPSSEPAAAAAAAAAELEAINEQLEAQRSETALPPPANSAE
ncbi:CG12498 [Drosophila busckii]|uniref:CG12498 n=1 Tax=Drosophila busckii TaxID=30019 RepID=A0A0M5J2X2_DROBS|nr:RNA polymerase-associated protein RTF1 homolog [Drosophila busckii]ALC48198.1 CG12498 [Drosophila busckii]